MNGTEIDPRTVAETLQMDTYALSERAAEEARRYLEGAHEAFKAWQQDNPEDEVV